LKTVKKLSWFIFLAIIAFSCLDEPDCFQLNNDIIGFSFRVLGSSKADTLQLTSLNVGALDGMYGDTTASAFSININYLAESMDLVFTGPEIGTRTMHLDYRVQTQFVSEDCGTRFILSGLQAPWDQTNFDSVRVVNGTPNTNSGGVNIAVYRCPEPKFIGVSFNQLYMEGETIVKANRRSKALEVNLKNVTQNDIVVHNIDTTASIYLPINKNDKVSEYTFNFSDDRYVTGPQKLRLTYDTTTEARFGKACPAKRYFTKIKIDNGLTTFDSTSFVTVKNNNTGLTDTLNRVLDPAETNVRIYRCPDMNMFQIAFKKLNASGSSTIEDARVIQSIKVDYTDSVFYGPVMLSYAQIPLNPNADETVIYVKYSETLTDTITVRYTRKSDVLFDECGSQQMYSDLVLPAGTSSRFKIANTSVKYPAVSNLEISK